MKHQLTWWDVPRYAVICPFLMGIFYDFEDWFTPTFWIMVIGLIVIRVLENLSKE